MKTHQHIIGFGLFVAVTASLALACSRSEDAAPQAPQLPESSQSPLGTDTPLAAEAPQTMAAQQTAGSKGLIPGEASMEEWLEEFPAFAISDEEIARVAREALENFEPYDWGGPGQLDPASTPNPYRHVGLGVTITRPSEWVWLPETSAPDYASQNDPAVRTTVVREHWDDPSRTPMIAMASVPDPVDGRDVRIALFVRPIPGSLSMLEAFIGNSHKVVQGELRKVAIDQENYELIEETGAITVSGITGATARVRYTVRGDESESRTLDETITYFARPPYLFFLRIYRPADAPGSTDQTIRDVLESLQIENGVAG